MKDKSSVSGTLSTVVAHPHGERCQVTVSYTYSADRDIGGPFVTIDQILRDREDITNVLGEDAYEHLTAEILEHEETK